MKIKLHILEDKNSNSIKIKKILNKKVKSYPIKKSNLIIVIGGDGFMLNSLKKYYRLKKPFYGINSGTYGFLMNKFSRRKTLKNIYHSKLVKINPLKMTVKTKKNIIKKSIAINEISILRQSRQAASLSIFNGKNKIIKKLVSDGVIVSTPAGSTAYNMSVHGPILDLNSKKIAISPISPFRPRRWKGKILSENKKITIRNLDLTKRPISAVADNIEYRNIKTVKIEVSNKINFNLLFDKNNSLEKKIKIEQIKKETGK